jgi:PKHD-type hydroxylase
VNLENYYYYFDSALTPRFCDEVIEHGNSIKKEMAMTGYGGVKTEPPSQDEISEMKKKRESNVSWFDDPWVYNEIHPYVHIANEKAGWNFQWDWSEAFQFTEYKPGQFYDWHTDASPAPYNCPNDINRHGKVRKISLSVMLTDPEEYEGGELQFNFKANDPQFEKDEIRTVTEVSSRGSLVLFPSFLWHRVKPVTKGIRHSLVCWNLGQPYV